MYARILRCCACRRAASRRVHHGLDNGRRVTADAVLLTRLSTIIAKVCLPRMPRCRRRLGMDAETRRSILDELRDMHAEMAAWRRQDEMERRVDRDRRNDEHHEGDDGERRSRR